MHRLYQWVHEQAIFFLKKIDTQGIRRTVRTEVTVLNEERTLLVGRGGAAALDTCPLCGHALSSAPGEAGEMELAEKPPIKGGH